MVKTLEQLNVSIYDTEHSKDSTLAIAEVHRNRHIARANSVFELLLRRHPEDKDLLVQLWTSLSDAEDVSQTAVIEHCHKVLTR